MSPLPKPCCGWQQEGGGGKWTAKSRSLGKGPKAGHLKMRFGSELQLDMSIFTALRPFYRESESEIGKAPSRHKLFKKTNHHIQTVTPRPPEAY